MSSNFQIIQDQRLPAFVVVLAKSLTNTRLKQVWCEHFLGPMTSSANRSGMWYMRNGFFFFAKRADYLRCDFFTRFYQRSELSDMEIQSIRKNMKN